jgi:hypothetical protein
MNRPVVRAHFSDDIGASPALMRVRFKLAKQASQRAARKPITYPEPNTLGWSDAFTVTPLHMVVLN